MRLNKLLGSVAEAGKELLLSKRDKQPVQKPLESYCADLLSSKGEALGTAIAVEVAEAYNLAESDQKLAFFNHLLEHYSPDPEKVFELANQYRLQQDHASFAALNEAIEAPRQTLFRRINMAPQGIRTLVQLRRDLLEWIKTYPQLKPIDYDLQHLFRSWFNRGFLSLKEISWHTSAHILEKLIQYEAVHTMSGWDDLKKRLSKNRRCFAFFHPSLPNEPLIFVEVALVNGLADKVQPLIDPVDPPPEESTSADTAIFYSISNCQQGLAGISFGNFLIKQVVMELKQERPGLNHFATLSPIPGFRKWLRAELQNPESQLIPEQDHQRLAILEEDNWHTDPSTREKLRPCLMKLCQSYLLHAKKSRYPLDPVSRFHLGNGARIERINWMGDNSDNGIKQSAGILVNYYYDIAQVEKNHEAFINDGTIATSKHFMKDSY